MGELDTGLVREEFICGVVIGFVFVFVLLGCVGMRAMLSAEDSS